MRELKIFSGRANPELASKLCQHLHLAPAAITLGQFPDGENYCKLDEDVRGRDIFLVQPTCPPVNDHLIELLTMIDCCKRASAARITAVIPYYGYARQDRKDEGRVPITAKLVANLITRAGADRVLTMDLHAAQIQGFFDVPVDHLYAAPVLNDHFLQRGLTDDAIVVVSPDEGSIKRAVGHAKRLGGPIAIIDKRRSNALEVRQSTIIGGPGRRTDRVDVRRHDQHRRVDLWCRTVGETGGRPRDPYRLHPWRPLRSRHPTLRDAPIDSITLTDSIPIPADKQLPHLVQLSIAPLLAEAIKRIHHDQSISELFRER